MGEVVPDTVSTILIGGPAHGRTIAMEDPKADLSTVTVLPVELTGERQDWPAGHLLLHRYKPRTIELFGRRVPVHLFDQTPVGSRVIPYALLSYSGQDVYGAGWKGSDQPPTGPVTMLRLDARPGKSRWIEAHDAAALVVEFDGDGRAVSSARKFVLFGRWVRIAVPMQLPPELGWFDAACAQTLLTREGFDLWKASA